jgi:thiol-disulfide isomerase/thioredoxin
MISRALIAIALVYGLAACEGGKTQANTHRATACKAGDDGCLPDVKYVDTTGKAYTVQQLAGKVVVVNFWATWCHPCQKEIPDLSKLYEKYKHDVVMLGILMDTPSDNDLLNFQSDHAMSYPVVRGSSDILVSYNYPQALPTTFVFDKTGHRVGNPRIGAIRPEDLDRQLAELVAQK